MKSTPPILCCASSMRSARAEAQVHEIILAPLTCQDLGRLLVDTLHCESERIAPLAHLVHAKTDRKSLFRHSVYYCACRGSTCSASITMTGRWSWDLNRIQAKGYTDNVADLMVGKLNRLPLSRPRRHCKSLPVWGTVPRISTLSIVHGRSSRTAEDRRHWLRICGRLSVWS